MLLVMCVPLSWTADPRLAFALGDSLRALRKRPMNVAVCRENLLLLHTILSRAAVPFWLSEGTALGVHREGRLLPWDDDVDIGLHHDHDSSRPRCHCSDGVAFSGRWRAERRQVHQPGQEE